MSIKTITTTNTVCDGCGNPIPNARHVAVHEVTYYKGSTLESNSQNEVTAHFCCWNCFPKTNNEIYQLYDKLRRVGS